jgi:hypothetical protein
MFNVRYIKLRIKKLVCNVKASNIPPTANSIEIKIACLGLILPEGIGLFFFTGCDLSNE